MSLRFMLSRHRRPAVALSVLLVVLAACGGDPGGDPVDPPQPPQIVSVALSPSTIELNGASQTATIAAVVTSTAGTVASPTITWSSTDPAIATVAANGSSALVTAVAAGSASIRATSGGVVGSAEVTVLPPSSISLLVAPASGAAGGIATTGVTIQRNNYTLPVTLELLGAPSGVTGSFGSGSRPPPGAGEVQALVLTIVASVAPGKYAMSVRATGSGLVPVTQSFELTVLAPPVAIVTVTPNKGEMQVGSTLQLSVETRSADGAIVAGRTIVWTSSASSRASVSMTGLVTAIAAGDSVTITATSEGVSASARILVRGILPTDFVDVASCADRNGWFAIQDGPSAAWTRVAQQGTRFALSLTNARIGLAYASYGWTSIVYLDQSELATLPIDHLCNIADVNANERQIGVRFASNTPLDAVVSGRIGTSTSEYLPSLVAILGAVPVPAPRNDSHNLVFLLTAKPDSLRALIRRQVDMTPLPDGAVLQTPLDFFGNESGPIATAPLTLSGFPATGLFGGYLTYESFAAIGPECSVVHLPRENGFVNVSLFALADVLASPRPDSFASRSDVQSSLGIWGGFVFTRGAINDAYAAAGLTASLLRPGDVVGGTVAFASLTSLSEGEARVVSETYGGLAARSIQAPSPMPAVYPSIVNGTTYRRFRVQLTLPPDLDDAFVVRYEGLGGHTLSMRASATWLQGRAVDLTVPDFTALPGWDNGWGPSGQTQFELRGEKSTRASVCSIGRTAMSMRIGPV